MSLDNLSLPSQYGHQSFSLAKAIRQDSDGNWYLAINQALNPLDGYHIAHEDIGDTSYYGYLNSNGEWYIMRAVRTDNVVAYTYVSGSSGYATAWTNRSSQSYASFDTTF